MKAKVRADEVVVDYNEQTPILTVEIDGMEFIVLEGMDAAKLINTLRDALAKKGAIPRVKSDNCVHLKIEKQKFSLLDAILAYVGIRGPYISAPKLLAELLS